MVAPLTDALKLVVHSKNRQTGKSKKCTRKIGKVRLRNVLEKLEREKVKKPFSLVNIIKFCRQILDK